jgi:small subunit ribosomal protein S3
MTHKTNPLVHRLGIIYDWQSRYFVKQKRGFFLEEDALIRTAIQKKFKRSGIESIGIERNANTLKIYIKTARPGFIIGKGGTGVEELRKILQAKIKILREKSRQEKEVMIQLNIEEVKKPEISAKIVAENVAVSLERRMPFRKTIKNTLAKVMSYRDVKGAKIKVSGRLDGVEISRREFVAEGKIPLVTIRSLIDYAEERAYCTYGVIGIKVWIYKGEILEKDLI